MKLIDCWKCELCGRVAFDKEEMSFHENKCDGFMYGTVTMGGVTTVTRYKGDIPIAMKTLGKDKDFIPFDRPFRHGVEQ